MSRASNKMYYRYSKTLYAAKKGKKYVGIFTSAERLGEISYDTLDMITLSILEGTPNAEEYACVASGVWALTTKCENEIKATYYDIGPIWGANVQTAIVGLLGDHFNRKRVELCTLQIYEINKNYSVDSPMNLADKFKYLAYSYGEEASSTNEFMNTDYIARYHIEQISKIETEEKCQSQTMKLIINKVMNIIVAADAPMCGKMLNRIEGHIERVLCHTFSISELKIIAVIWGLERNEVISEQIILGTIPPNDVKKLLEKIQVCISKVHFCFTKRKKLQDYI